MLAQQRLHGNTTTTWFQPYENLTQDLWKDNNNLTVTQQQQHCNIKTTWFETYENLTQDLWKYNNHLTVAQQPLR